MTVSRPRGPRGPAIHSPIETAPYWSDELARYQSECLEASHALLLGRVTYDGFAAAWPSRAGDPFADRMNSLPKFVVSRGQMDLRWNNSHLISGEVYREIARMKHQTGGDILIYGSGQLLHSLLVNGLVDELRLIVEPVVLGSGRRLFADATKTELRLARAR